METASDILIGENIGRSPDSGGPVYGHPLGFTHTHRNRWANRRVHHWTSTGLLFPVGNYCLLQASWHAESYLKTTFRSLLFPFSLSFTSLFLRVLCLSLTQLVLHYPRSHSVTGLAFNKETAPLPWRVSVRGSKTVTDKPFDLVNESTDCVNAIYGFAIQNTLIVDGKKTFRVINFFCIC